MTGPTRHVRPKKKSSCGPNSHPFQTYPQGVKNLLQRGWMRHCYQVVTDATGVFFGYIHTDIWLDNKVLNMISTVHMAATNNTTNVLRWCREKFRREKIIAPLAVVFYQKYMGAVDRMDKVISCIKIKMKRCKRRYHRCLFLVRYVVLGSFEGPQYLL